MTDAEARTFEQVGILVRDIDAAAAQLERAAGLRFEEPVERRLGEWRILVAFSLLGPPYVELIQAPDDSPWGAPDGPRLDHLAFWSTDLDAERARLAAAGLPVAIDGVALGGRWTYHHADAVGGRIEHIEESARRGYGLRRGGPDRRSTQTTVEDLASDLAAGRFAEATALFHRDGVLDLPGSRPFAGCQQVSAALAGVLGAPGTYLLTVVRTVLVGATATLEARIDPATAGPTTRLLCLLDIDEDGAIRRMLAHHTRVPPADA
jgi:hypothetical protein